MLISVLLGALAAVGKSVFPLLITASYSKYGATAFPTIMLVLALCEAAAIANLFWTGRRARERFFGGVLGEGGHELLEARAQLV